MGDEAIQNIPFSVAILPHDIIQNSQASNFKEVSKYLPLVAFQEQQGPEVLRAADARHARRQLPEHQKMDGMTMFITGPTALEGIEQIEVVNGLTSSL